MSQTWHDSLTARVARVDFQWKLRAKYRRARQISRERELAASARAAADLPADTNKATTPAPQSLNQ